MKLNDYEKSNSNYFSKDYCMCMPVKIFCKMIFSNTLIILEEETKEIITVGEVCICDPNNFVKFGELLL